jgi:sigma-B regulation protein RsbU (phosphoserine phosphatase)
MLKSLMYEHPDEPAAVLRCLNSAINYYFDLSFFVTVFYAVVDTENGTIDYANAGHPPGILITNGGKLHNALGHTGTPVGAGAECDYRARQVPIEPGDVLFLYTDGVTDAVCDGQPLEVEGLHRVVFAAAELPISQLVEHVCRHLAGLGGSGQNDDTTLLAVSFHGASQALHDDSGGIGSHGRSLTVGAA